MRSIFAAIALSASTAVAFGEEAYTLTGRAFGACIGTQMRVKYNPPERIVEFIKQNCGKEQFSDFLKGAHWRNVHCRTRLHNSNSQYSVSAETS
jgi:hypothetical protein